MCSYRGEDVTKREGVRARRPRSARRSKSRDSRVTLSEGSYEEVKLTDSEDSEEETFVEDRGCQTGWELFVQYDQVCCQKLLRLASRSVGV